MNWSEHPITVVDKLVSRCGSGLAFQFSTYRYTPLSVKDERQAFWVPARDVTPAGVQALIDGLPPGHDLSLHSRVATEVGNCQHIPMIDFAGSLSATKLSTIDALFPKEMLAELVIFRSGKSFHGYVPTLISHEEWHRFCGLLLLMNLPNAEPVIDARWIGHRLRGGFSALRWSCHSNSYTICPSRVGTIAEIKADARLL